MSYIREASALRNIKLCYAGRSFSIRVVIRCLLLDYLSKHDIFIPWEEFELNSNGTDLKIKPRFSFALTSLEHAGLVCHPQRGMTALTDLGNKTRTSDTHVVKELVTAGWQKYNESKD